MLRRSRLICLATRLAPWRSVGRSALALLFCLVLALAPSLAEARAGGSFKGSGKSSFSSMGSRGSRTIENNSAAPLTRSMNPANPAASAAAGTPAAAGAGRSVFQRHPFLTGLTGGFLGAMLFSSLGGMGHAVGGILQFLIIGGLLFLAIRLAMRFFAGRGLAGIRTPSGPLSPMAPMPRSVGAAASPAPRYRGVDTTVGDSDLTAFQSTHAAVQEAWARSDLGRLRQLMTPEMLSYFSEELTRNASQGVQNLVSDVKLLKGEIAESWEEGDLQYATAYMRWSAIDYSVWLDRSPGSSDSVASGDPKTPIESEELWTFVRHRGGAWLLSAIQQV